MLTIRISFIESRRSRSRARVEIPEIKDYTASIDTALLASLTGRFDWYFDDYVETHFLSLGRAALASQDMVVYGRMLSFVERMRRTSRNVSPRSQVSDHQVQEAHRHRDVGDVGRVDLTGPINLQLAKQVRMNLVRFVRIRGSLLRDTPPQGPSCELDDGFGVFPP